MARFRRTPGRWSSSFPPVASLTPRFRNGQQPERTQGPKPTLGFRLKLNSLAEATLSETKLADGMQSLQWWKEGRYDLIEMYCKKDVEVTSRLYRFGREKGYLLYRDLESRLLRVPVEF